MAITGTELMAIQAGASILSGLMGSKRRRREQREAKAAREEMRAKYESLDTSNLFADMENPYEDLTVNLQQAEFIRQQQQQQQANLLSGLQQAAGGSGIGGLAQAIAGQQTVAAQQAAASIGQQEAQNKRLAAQAQGRIDALERQGALQARQLEASKTATLFGIESQRLAEANLARARARQAVASGIGSLAVMGISGKFDGMFGGAGGVQTPAITGAPTLQTGSIQGLNYLPPQQNFLSPGFGNFGFSQQTGLFSPYRFQDIKSIKYGD